MAFNSKQSGPYAANTSPRAPGSSGPSPVPSDSGAAQPAVAKVQANPGDPNFSAQMALKGVHPKSKQVPTHSAHVNTVASECRGTMDDGQAVLDGATTNDWAGE